MREHFKLSHDEVMEDDIENIDLKEIFISTIEKLNYYDQIKRKNMNEEEEVDIERQAFMKYFEI